MFGFRDCTADNAVSRFHATAKYKFMSGKSELDHGERKVVSSVQVHGQGRLRSSDLGLLGVSAGLR